MNEKEKEVLQENHDYLVRTLDPLFFRPFLFQNGLISTETYLDSEPIRQRRAETFLEQIKTRCSFSLFLEILGYENQYNFVADKLQSDIGFIHKQQKIQFGKNREHVINFRHQMKRLINGNEIRKYNALYQSAITNWRESHEQTLSISKRQLLADLCFVAIDSEIDRRRVTYTNYQDTLHNSDLFMELKNIASDTSTPTLPSVMKQVRYGSALIMAGESLDKGMSYIEQAKQMMKVLPACFETGTVLYIEFNVQLQIYEQKKIPIDKEKMTELGKEAMGHFAAEGQEIGDDFKRFLMLKIAYTKLGMGIFLDFVDCKESITADLVREATEIIERVKKESWSRMERRAKMVYYSIKSRIMQLSQKFIAALELSKVSLKYAKRGNFKKEISSISRNIGILEKQRETQDLVN